MKARGRGWAAGMQKVGMIRSQDSSAAFVQVKQDGSVIVQVGSVEVGQGLTTAMAQIAAEALGVPIDVVSVVCCDTETAPYDGGTVGSRSTYIVGNAVRAAAENVKELIAETVSQDWEAPPADLEFRDGSISIKGMPWQRTTFADAAFRTQFERRVLTIGKGSFQPATGRVQFRGGAEGFRRDANVLMDSEAEKGAPVATYGYAAAYAEIEVDTETGIVDVQRLVAATDCGRAINPLIVEGQLQGALVQGLGYALYEDTRPPYAPDHALTLNFRDYHVPTFLDVPDIEVHIVECPEPTGPFGAKGVGEINIILAGAAIANAIEDAVGVRLDRLPASPDNVLAGILAKNSTAR
jgi:CO/xanthine dehydrogenase Mo-binding subunit